MLRKVFVFLISIPLLVSAAPPQVPTDGSPHPMPKAIGLTLSGGGAKGVAHIGVIQALEDNDIPIDCITGTSMGSIVGGLYAMGYSPKEMLQLIQSRPFQYWSTGKIDEELTYYFLETPPSEKAVNIHLGSNSQSVPRGLTSTLPTSLIDPLPMNFAFVELFTPYTAQCDSDFNKLMVPYRCVASDVNRKRKAIFSRGDLGECIRASMSFPLVFEPIEIDGRPMYDGGIYDNFPVDVMLSEFNPAMVIGVDVSSGNTPVEPNSSMMAQLEDLIMQHSDYQVPATKGMRLKMDLDRFGLLDFGQAQQIYDIGYNYAMSMMDSIKSRVKERRPKQAVAAARAKFKRHTPTLTFSEVSVTGGNHRQNEYLSYLFDRNTTDTITIDQARDAYYRAITSGKLRNLVPSVGYDSPEGPFKLNLDATVKKDFNVAAGGYLTTSTNSMLYVAGGFRTLSFNSLNIGAQGWLGQSYIAAQADAEFQLLRSNPSSIGLQAVASRQKSYPRERFFFQTADPTVLTTDEYFGKLIFATAAGRRAKAKLEFGMGHIENTFMHQRPETLANPRLGRLLGQIAGRYDYNTLDDQILPTAGIRLLASAQILGGKYTLHRPSGGSEITDFDRRRAIGRADISLQIFRYISPHFSLGGNLLATATTDKLIPDYNAALAASPYWNPTPDMSDLFIPGLRAHQFAVIGAEPVWKVGSLLQIRGRAEAFIPYRTISQSSDFTPILGAPWHNPQFFGQIRAVVRFNYASVSTYAHYISAHGGNWNFGLSIGVCIPAATFF